MGKIVFDITRKSLEEVGVDPDYILMRISLMYPTDVQPLWVRGFLSLQPEKPHPAPLPPVVPV